MIALFHFCIKQSTYSNACHHPFVGKLFGMNVFREMLGFFCLFACLFFCFFFFLRNGKIWSQVHSRLARHLLTYYYLKNSFTLVCLNTYHVKGLCLFSGSMAGNAQRQRSRAKIHEIYLHRRRAKRQKTCERER